MQKEKLEIEIQSPWSAAQLQDCFAALQNLYNLYGFQNNLLQKKYAADIHKQDIIAISYLLTRIFTKKPKSFSTGYRFQYKPVLVLRDMFYGNNGRMHLEGERTVILQLKETMEAIFERVGDRSLPFRRVTIKLQLSQLDRNRRYADLLTNIGYSEKEIDQCLVYEVENLYLFSHLWTANKIKDLK